jgi:hypothetical protein
LPCSIPVNVTSSIYRNRLLRGGYTLLLFFTAAHAASPEATVHGVVTNTATGAGLRKAYVTFTPADGGSSYHAVTTDQGIFTIENLPPGNYNLEAECAGFLDKRANSALRVVANGDGTSIEIKLTPQAVMSGRVLDQDGDPWPHASIGIYHSVWEKGRKRIESAEYSSTSEVNDRGEFRIAGLAPGRYYVRAEPDDAWEKQHHPDMKGQPALRQQPTWYPSSFDTDSSVPITLSAGEQFNGLDIRLGRGVGSRLRIRGKVSGLQNIPPPQGDPRMVERRIGARRASIAAEVDQFFSGSLKPDGSFEITDVASGVYDVWLTQGYAWSARLGQTTVQVDDRDVENVSIEVHPPQTLHVIVSVEGDAAKPPRIPLYLEAVTSLGVDPFSTPRDDGSIDFGDVGLGRYRVYLPDTFRGAYLKSLRYGNAESHDGTFTLAAYGVPLELTFSTRGARISGTIMGKTKTPPRVVLIPTTSDAARTATFDQNGVFTIEAIPPGSYKLYAFENVPEDIWLAPEFLKEIESAGVPFEATEGAASAIQLPLVSKSDTDRVLAKLGIE